VRHRDSDLEGLLAGIINTAIPLGTAHRLGVVASVTAGLLSDGFADVPRAGFSTCVAAASWGSCWPVG
jgi:hypothetical protein